MSDLVVPAGAWILLGVIVVVAIAIDLFAHRGDHVDSRGRAVAWSLGWIAVALGFGGYVWWQFGADAGEQYVAAWLLEKSLSVDNLFLFVAVFGALSIPTTEQRRVLTWGIAGALVFRAIFIAVGAAVLSRWHAVTFAFGGLLIVAAINMLRNPKSDEKGRLLEWLERRLPWTRERAGHKFLVKKDGRWLATPLLVALVVIELADVAFAVDSIPAAFSVSEEPFIVYSSNVFAVLGLRALYIVLVDAIRKLRYLKLGLSAVLAFAGAKLIAAPWLHIDALVSILVIAGIIIVAVAASVRANRRDGARAVQP